MILGATQPVAYHAVGDHQSSVLDPTAGAGLLRALGGLASPHVVSRSAGLGISICVTASGSL